ncbi:hypothetical protein LEMLEM_LOCUS20650 [Lemmus lemmus]
MLLNHPRPPPECWDHSRVPPCPVYAVLRTESKTSCIPGKYSPNEAKCPTSKLS